MSNSGLPGPESPGHLPATLVRRVLLVFFLSGLSSLTYQVVWQKALSQIIGLDHYSVTLIVSIFMLGLGLGGIAGSWVCRISRNLLAIYVAIELLLGIFGFFSLDVLRDVNLAVLPYQWGYVGDFFVNFMALLLPTLLMGMSLPVILHIFRNSYPAGQAVGVVYSANILGAAAGAMITGFLLIGTIGMIRSCQLAAAINIMLAVVVSLAFRNRMVGSAIASPGMVAVALDRKLLLVSFLSGFAALSYEIIFFRIFTTYFGSTSYVFPILLFSYLMMMAVGNRYFGEKADRTEWAGLFIAMAALAVVTTLMVLWGQEALHRAGFRQNYLVFWPFQTWLAFVQVIPILVLSFILMAPVAFLSGFFPVIVKIATRSNDQLGPVAGKRYFSQTLGNFTGAVLTGFALLPWLGTVGALKFMAGILGILVIMALGSEGRLANVGRHAWLMIAVAAPAVFMYPQNYYGTVRLYHEGEKDNSPSPDIVQEGAFGTTLGYRMKDYIHVYVGRLFSNSFPGRGVQIDSLDSCFPMDWISAVKGLEVKRVLYIGLGSGVGPMCIRKIFPDAVLDIVEINPELVTMIRQHAADQVQQSLKSSNVHIADGRRFVRQSGDTRYDLIQVGVFNAWCSGCGNAFTAEFFSMLADHLTSHGVVTYNAYPAAVKAGLNVFRDMIVLSPGASRISEVCASNGPQGQEDWRLELDAQKFRQNTQRWVDGGSGYSVRVNPRFLEEGSVLHRKDIEGLVSGINAATDDRPVTEYFLTNNQFIYSLDWRDAKPPMDMRVFLCPDCPPHFLDVAL